MSGLGFLNQVILLRKEIASIPPQMFRSTDDQIQVRFYRLVDRLLKQTGTSVAAFCTCGVKEILCDDSHHPRPDPTGFRWNVPCEHRPPPQRKLIE